MVFGFFRQNENLKTRLLTTTENNDVKHHRTSTEMSENRLIAKPSQRPDSIDEILSTLKRYDVSVIKDLEDYVNDQHTKDYSDLNSNLALLKLYELSDDTSVEREEATIKILIKGLIEFTEQDFTLYLHLLPSFVFTVKNEYTTKIQNLVSLYEILISNKYDAFIAKNKEFDSILDESAIKLVDQTFNSNKSSAFISTKAISEDIPVTRLSKVIGQLVQN